MKKHPKAKAVKAYAIFYGDNLAIQSWQLPIFWHKASAEAQRCIKQGGFTIKRVIIREVPRGRGKS